MSKYLKESVLARVYVTRVTIVQDGHIVLYVTGVAFVTDGLTKSPTADFDEFLAQIQSLKNKNTKPPKRVPVSLDDEEENGSPAQSHHLMSSAKKKKYEQHGTNNLVQGKLLKFMAAEFIGRKRFNDNILKRLSEIKEAIEADYDVMKQNGQKFKEHTAAIMKWKEHTTLALEQKMTTLAEIQTEFKKRSEDMDSAHKTEVAKLAKAVEDDIEQLEQRLVADTKKRGWDNVRKSLFEAMKSDFD